MRGEEAPARIGALPTARATSGARLSAAVPEREPEEEEALRAASVEIDSVLAREIDDRMHAPAGEWLVSVTDLIDPRIAFYRTRAPIPPAPARAQRMATGRRIHERIERILAAPGQREVRLVREGVVGRIDLLAELPTEIKSTSVLPEPDRLVGSRPQYIDQLGMYCGLTGRTEGRILVVAGADGGPWRVLILDCRFRDAAELWRRTAGAAARLREAFRTQLPEPLFRCGWFGRGCEYEAARLCACTGAEPEDPAPLRQELAAWRENPQAARDLEGRLNTPAAEPGEPPIALYRELLYPRRTFFERSRPAPETAAAPEGGAAAPTGTPPNLYQRLREALEAGAAGELVREVPPGDVPEEQVLRFRGEILLLKTSGVGRPPGAAELRDRHALYLFELGLRCAASGTASGRLLVGYDRLPRDSGPLRVFRVRFDSTERWIGILRRREERLRESLRSGRPDGLANCPVWMFADCPYRAECGDGPPAPTPPAAPSPSPPPARR